MPEVDVTGINEISYPHMGTWEWHVAVYLFLGGLVAGMMIFSAWFRLRKYPNMGRAIAIVDLLSMPLLGFGLLLLWLDLARRWNAWRFYATFQASSPMSWGAWILLFAFLVLFIRILTHIAAPPSASPANLIGRIVRPFWRLGAAVGGWFSRLNLIWDAVTILLGVGLGAYTGFLLSTIPARPLWDSPMLPVLFLVSGLAAGLAVFVLLLPSGQGSKMAAMALVVGLVEVAAVAGYLLTLAVGTEATRRALDLLLNNYALAFWGGVVLLGLLVPLAIEFLEVRRRHLSPALVRAAPLLILIGGLILRFVVLYAGLESYI